jgi:plastocyanin
MKKLLAATAVTTMAAAAAIPALAATKNVKVGDNYYVHDGGRPAVGIARGSTLKFNWKSSSPHNIVKKSGPGGRINSGVKVRGSWSHTFKRAGTYVLYCTIHGAKDMSMTVNVH